MGQKFHLIHLKGLLNQRNYKVNSFLRNDKENDNLFFLVI